MINLHERMLPNSVGVEPATSWSPVWRRIQLSHRRRYTVYITRSLLVPIPYQKNTNHSTESLSLPSKMVSTSARHLSCMSWCWAREYIIKLMADVVVSWPVRECIKFITDLEKRSIHIIIFLLFLHENRNMSIWHRCTRPGAIPTRKQAFCKKWSWKKP